jgi:DNA-binding transcriptional ArsR family regulator
MSTHKERDADADDYASDTYFVDALGDSAKTRILATLLGSHTDDLNITEIARIAGIDRTTVYQHLDDLLDYGLIEHTRTVGNSKMYQINKDNPAAEKLAAFEWELLDHAD